MFEKIILRLLELRTPTTRKLKIPIAGPKALEAIIMLSEVKDPATAIQIATKEFSKYSKGDSQAVSDFKKILSREFSGLNNTKLLKKKAKVLKEIWELEARTLAAKNKRNKWLSIRVTEEEYEKISKQAQGEGLDVSNYIRKRLGLEYKS